MTSDVYEFRSYLGFVLRIRKLAQSFSVTIQRGNNAEYTPDGYSGISSEDEAHDKLTKLLADEKKAVPAIAIEDNIEFDANIINLFGKEIIVEMMKQDGLNHNKATKLTTEKLYQMSKRYDVTIRTSDGLTRVFLAPQTTYLPGDFGDEQR